MQWSLIQTESPWWFWVAAILIAAVTSAYKLRLFVPSLTRVDQQILDLLAERYVKGVYAQPYASTIAREISQPVELVNARLERLLSLRYVERDKNKPIWRITIKGLQRTEYASVSKPP